MAKKLFIFSVFIITAFSVSAQRGCLKSRFSETNYFDSASIKIDDSISYGSAQIWPSTTVKNLQMDI
ncbi:MAG: hypothetical protein H7321_08075, partial [Bacteroidia bacterium]|nr:hypothetical protein [Bacteroidia bacterium]